MDNVVVGSVVAVQADLSITKTGPASVVSGNNMTHTIVATNNGTDPGDGDSSPDWIVMDAHHVRLRAERAGSGSGRVYTIAITATNSEGGTSTFAVAVRVPHDSGQ